MEELRQNGRIDIVIFEDGGWAVIAMRDSNPLPPEGEMEKVILDFVKQHQNLEYPEKYTLQYEYDSESGDLTIEWGEYLNDDFVTPQRNVDPENPPMELILTEDEITVYKMLKMEMSEEDREKAERERNAALPPEQRNYYYELMDRQNGVVPQSEPQPELEIEEPVMPPEGGTIHKG